MLGFIGFRVCRYEGYHLGVAMSRIIVYGHLSPYFGTALCGHVKGLRTEGYIGTYRDTFRLIQNGQCKGVGAVILGCIGMYRHVEGRKNAYGCSGCVHIHIHSFTCVHTFICIHMCIYMSVHVNKHICLDTYIHKTYNSTCSCT